MESGRSLSGASSASAITPKSLKMTRALLAGGVLAGPLYLSVSLIQAFTREGFDLTRHNVSLLSNGELGWIQITNFLASGLLVVIGAIGMRRAIHSGRGRTWGPLLVGFYGLGLIGAGIFVADPMNGFPPGTPQNAATVSLQGLYHFLFGGVGFLALIAACFVFASRFAATEQRGWAVYSLFTGVTFLAAFFGISSGSPQEWTVIGFWIGVVLAWAWISLVALKLAKTSPLLDKIWN